MNVHEHFLRKKYLTELKGTFTYIQAISFLNLAKIGDRFPKLCMDLQRIYGANMRAY